MRIRHIGSGRRTIFAAMVAATLAAGASQASAGEPANPLATRSLGALTATRERPLFSPTRRAALAIETPTPVAAAPAAPQPVVAEPVPFVLVGTVTGEGRQIALARASGGDVVALAAGDVRDGWTVRAVTARRVVFDRDGRSEELALTDIPAQGAMATEVAATTVPVATELAPEPVVPAHHAIAAAEPDQAPFAGALMR